jgi:2,3-bisphosphoglycerate-dependent phosphoglycerate mutase
VTRRLVLARHGRVDASSRNFLQTARGRQWDPPLDDVGREQAGHLAARLATTAPSVAAFVSPFRRCAETMAPIADRTGVGATVVDDLGEVNVGDWEGVPFDVLVAENEDFIRRRLHEHEAIFAQAPGAEGGSELRARVVPAIERMLAGVDDGDVLAVAHGGVINAYVGHVLGIDQDMFFLPENASLTVVRADGDERVVRFLGDAAHLFFPSLWESSPAIGG